MFPKWKLNINNYEKMAQCIQNAIIIYLSHTGKRKKKQSSNNSQVEIYIESKNSQLRK